MNEGKLVALGTPSDLKHEIGGDVIWLEAAHDPRDFANASPRDSAVKAIVIGDHDQEARIRLETENGHRFIAELADAFPGEIQSISVSKPTLEDVFIRRTGHRFWTEGTPVNPETDAPKRGVREVG